MRINDDISLQEHFFSVDVLLSNAVVHIRPKKERGPFTILRLFWRRFTGRHIGLKWESREPFPTASSRPRCARFENRHS